ncbi:MAG TPA: nucleoside hydrolase, partial [Ilumatobacteraceae bacterium]
MLRAGGQARHRSIRRGRVRSADVDARKILIDTDPGIDDAMAIFYALAAPELDVVGLTTVFGNVDTALC